ncbi:succinyl-CoA:3-ketoacid-coenzyme A transferase 1 [Ascobolus immersus RN42]|uniref:Succinyl-CoA:3-ketoacid-coenzyme A transferase n=1 Tax=Ascobolus immersus RN42 TaxID=1160509 RepID=A0A3N4HUB8_ASCIM|nr:succinyl-CoA:3-ketoacid-coenzyme A transferase 1 [Ascobolus immersus RN42]
MGSTKLFVRTVGGVLRGGKGTQSILLARTFSSSTRRFNIDKVVPSALEAIRDIPSGSTILSGGFGLCGVPNTLIKALVSQPHIKDLTCVSNNAGIDTSGLGLLLASGQIRKMIASYVGENKTFERKYLTGEIDLELTPQGTLAERCRAGGAGIPAFYTPAAVGTWVQTGELPVRYKPDGTVAVLSKPKEVREFGGRQFVMEEAIVGDYALVKAWKADKLGNCVFRHSANNFNGVMGRAGKVTIVEAEEIVEVGELEPSSVHLPGVYVSKVVQAVEGKGIEKLTFSEEPVEEATDKSALGEGKTFTKRDLIVRRAAKEFKNGMYANLGIGMPMLAPNFVGKDVSVVLQSENGILGLGPYPVKGKEDADLINAGKETVTLAAGASVFGSEESFAMIRSGRIDLSILGAMQVSAKGDLASWALPGKIKGMGGAMDLVSNPKRTRVVVTMEHTDRKGNPKILDACTFPLTGPACVSRIITDLCVFDVDPVQGLTLIELAEGVTEEEVRSKTQASFKVAEKVGKML